MQRDEARRLLGVPAGASATEVGRAFRRHARAAHPDSGGDPEAFLRLVAARTLLAGGVPVPRTRLIVRHSPARRLLRALRSRLPNARPPRVH
jgi:curved DNA-binding protein CbpA